MQLPIIQRFAKGGKTIGIASKCERCPFALSYVVFDHVKRIVSHCHMPHIANANKPFNRECRLKLFTTFKYID